MVDGGARSTGHDGLSLRAQQCRGPKVLLGVLSRRCYLAIEAPCIRPAKIGAWGRALHQHCGERSNMSTIAATSAKSAGMTKDERFVILASSLGTVFEWYDFYLYGSLAGIIGTQFFTIPGDDRQPVVD